MKSIDTKSLIIGALLTSTIFLGVAATSKEDKGKWDFSAQWMISTEDELAAMPTQGPKSRPCFQTVALVDPKTGKAVRSRQSNQGWEPYGCLPNGKLLFRKRNN